MGADRQRPRRRPVRRLALTTPRIRVSSEWLTLREPADAAARARDLVGQLRRRLPPPDPWVIHDLGAGTGSMGRWLAPLLPGRQRWVLHDQDTDLLTVAASNPPGRSALTVEARCSDVTRLKASDLAGVTLITASALLDLLTADDLAGLVRVCAGAECPVLFTLSVVGRVRLTPEEPLDSRVAAAFNAHQRRVIQRGRLLGPDAVAAAGTAFSRRGWEVLVRPSPWVLGPAHAGLASEWMRGWVSAACEQETPLGSEIAAYTRRRLAQAAAGQLSIIVDHADLLAVPASISSSR